MTLCSCGVLVNSYHDNICLQRKMAQNLVLRLLEEKQTETEVRFMLWSPKMDILALAFSSGSISLHRLQWQKIWTAETAEEEVVVGALAWRPDGKLLASGDSAGVLTIRHIENSTALQNSLRNAGPVWQAQSVFTCSNRYEQETLLLTIAN